MGWGVRVQSICMHLKFYQLKTICHDHKPFYVSPMPTTKIKIKISRKLHTGKRERNQSISILKTTKNDSKERKEGEKSYKTHKTTKW